MPSIPTNNFPDTKHPTKYSFFQIQIWLNFRGSRITYGVYESRRNCRRSPTNNFQFLSQIACLQKHDFEKSERRELKNRNLPLLRHKGLFINKLALLPLRTSPFSFVSRIFLLKVIHWISLGLHRFRELKVLLYYFSLKGPFVRLYLQGLLEPFFWASSRRPSRNVTSDTLGYMM